MPKSKKKVFGFPPPPIFYQPVTFPKRQLINCQLSLTNCIRYIFLLTLVLLFAIVMSNGLSAQRRSAFFKSGVFMDPADV